MSILIETPSIILDNMIQNCIAKSLEATLNALNRKFTIKAVDNALVVYRKNNRVAMILI